MKTEKINKLSGQLYLTDSEFFSRLGTLGRHDMWNYSPDLASHVDTLQNQLEERGRQCFSFLSKTSVAVL